MTRRWIPIALAAACAVGCRRNDPVSRMLRETDRTLLAWHLEGQYDTPGRQQLIADTETALKRLTEAKALAPHNPRVEHRRGVCLSLLGRYTEAEAALAGAEARAGPDDRPLVTQDRGLCAMRQGHYDEALRLFENVLAQRPWQPDTRYHMGLIYERRGDEERALRLYAEELEFNNRNSKAWQAYYRLKGLDETAGRSPRRLLWWLTAWGAAVLLTGAYVLIRRRRSRKEDAAPT